MEYQKNIKPLIDKKEDYHVIALQEVTIPFDENMSKIYGFINITKYSLKYNVFQMWIVDLLVNKYWT